MDFIELFFGKLDAFINSPHTLEMVVNNRFLMIFMVIVLLKFKYSTYSSMWLSALINIPGTILHETMHFLVGLFMNAHPTSYSLFPKKDGYGNYVMGSVGFRHITSYNAIPASLAPLLLLPIGYHLNIWYFENVNVNIFNYTLYVLLQTIIIENAVPSSTDFRVAFSYPLGIIIYGFIGILSIIYLL
ncbi:MAG: hypothetical protein IJW75_06580 [Alphaproteobacteria bacterium]|nr:hypothetical protein [Alphaproteobacteria bacterium]